MIGFGWELAVEAEESLLIGGERLDIDLILLVGVHLGLRYRAVRFRVTCVSDEAFF